MSSCASLSEPLWGHGCEDNPTAALGPARRVFSVQRPSGHSTGAGLGGSGGLDPSLTFDGTDAAIEGPAPIYLDINGCTNSWPARLLIKNKMLPS